MLRPERLKILDATAVGEAPAHRNLLRGTVQNVVYQGESYLLQARLADGSTVSLRGVSTDSALATMPKPGELVQLAFAPEDAVLVPDGAT
jgi:putative spermidine/putrescine transport system ATP-binding protein